MNRTYYSHFRFLFFCDNFLSICAKIAISYNVAFIDVADFSLQWWFLGRSSHCRQFPNSGCSKLTRWTWFFIFFLLCWEFSCSVWKTKLSVGGRHFSFIFKTNSPRPVVAVLAPKLQKIYKKNKKKTKTKGNKLLLNQNIPSLSNMLTLLWREPGNRFWAVTGQWVLHRIITSLEEKVALDCCSS